MKVVALSFLLLATAGIFPAMAQNQGNAASGKGKQTVTIRGKQVGFISVSPALQDAIEKKYGKRPDPDPNSAGPNTFVSKHGFVRLSPSVANGAGRR